MDICVIWFENDKDQGRFNVSQTNLGILEERERNQLEVYSGSDWSGSGDMKSTSSAVHILNGIIVHSTSRSQKCTSLSSTEAEWYAPSAGVCDAYYLQHIVEFVTGDSCETLILHTDNSAVRMLSLKFGVGRLRHIKGRMLWLQEKMANYELDIRQVPTLQNIADLNTKGHGKHRFLSLLYMFGFVTSKGSRVGEDELTKLQAKEAMKNHVKLIGQVLKGDVESRNGFSATSLNETAKRVLRVLSPCSLLEMVAGHGDGDMSPELKALGQSTNGDGWWKFFLQVAMTIFCLGVGIIIFMKMRRGRAERVLNFGVQHHEVVAHDEADETDGETDSQREARYRRDPIEECSDPDLWQQ